LKRCEYEGYYGREKLKLYFLEIMISVSIGGFTVFIVCIKFSIRVSGYQGIYTFQTVSEAKHFFLKDQEGYRAIEIAVRKRK